MTDHSMDDASQGVVDTTEPGALPDTNAADTGQVAEAGTPATPEVTPPAEPDAKPQADKPHWATTRLSQYSAKLKESNATLAAREARIAELERALNPNAPSPDATRQPTAADVDRLANERADKIAEQRESQRTFNAWDEAGTKASPTFRADCEALFHLGAASNPAVVPVLMDLDDSAAVVARLAADPAEAEKIFALPPHRMALALAKFAAKAPTPPPVSRAPAPLTPVAGAARVETDPDKMSMEDYVKWRDARDAKRK